MPNSMYNQFGPQNGISKMIGEINNFRNNFHGDARAEVEKMMKSGQLSQEQFNEFAQIANELSRYMK